MTGPVDSTSIRDLVRALGGPAAVGRALGITLEAVCNWQRHNAVPEARQLAVWRMAQAAGLPWRPPGAAGLTLPAPAPPPQPEPPLAQDQAA
jgi:hypothetical protein